MPLHLSDSDLRALTAAMRTLVTPASYSDLTAWRLASAEAVQRLVGADGAALTLFSPDSPPIVASGCWEGGASDSALATYVRAHHHRTLLEQRRLSRRLRAWVRRDLASRREFEATDYFQEWCRPTRALDSAGLCAPISRVASDEAVIHVTTTDPDRFEPEGKEVLLLRMLQPVFEAGLRTALMTSRWLGELEAMIDGLGEALLLYSTDGRLLHMNPSATKLAQRQPDRATLLDAASDLAIEFSGHMLTRHSERLPDPAPGSWPKRVLSLADGRCEFRATIIEAGFGASTAPLVLVVADDLAAGSLPTGAELCDTFGFTPREAEVALLLATASRNRAIASALGVTEHTARRHTEKVLAKLGIDSRAAVASTIRRRPPEYQSRRPPTI